LLCLQVDGIALLLQETLNLKSPLEFTGIIRCLQTIIDGEPLTPAFTDDLLEKCTANLAQVYLPEYTNNISEFCGFAIRLGPLYGKVVLRMTQVLWSLANAAGAGGNSAAKSFKSLVKRLPFLKENHEIVNELISFVLRETADVDDFIKGG
jgi:hypothetical protein